METAEQKLANLNIFAQQISVFLLTYNKIAEKKRVTVGTHNALLRTLDTACNNYISAVADYSLVHQIGQEGTVSLQQTIDEMAEIIKVMERFA